MSTKNRSNLRARIMVMAILGSVLVIPQLGIAQSEPLLCAGRAATIVGTEGNDALRGTDGPDVIVAKGGNDRIIGGAGDDVICGGEGNDSVWAGGGSDIVIGGAGTDQISGDAGNDRCEPMGGSTVDCETVVADDAQGIDETAASGSSDQPLVDGLECNGRAATIVGTSGSDTLRGTSGNDVIVGLEGNDRIIAGGGDDVVCAGPGNDSIWGGGGADVLLGGPGTDIITGDDGVDACAAETGTSASCESDALTGLDTSGDKKLETEEVLLAPAAIDPPQNSTTGVPQGTVLEVVSGDIEIRTAGTVIDGKDVHGCVRVYADDVTIRRSRITCPSGVAALRQGSSFGGLMIEDVTIRGIGSMDGAGIYSQAPMTVRRADISNVVDGIFAYTDTVIEDSWIHDLRTTEKSHNDLIQMVAGERVVIRNNLLEHTRGQTSAIMIKSDIGTIDDVIIDNNVMAGGSFTLYVYAGNAFGGCCAAPTNVRVTNNTVRADSYLYGAMSIQGDAVVTCNVDEGGNPVTYFADHHKASPKVSAC